MGSMLRSATIVTCGVIAVAPWGHAAFIGRNEFGIRPTLSVAWEDFDGDGDLDLAVANYSAGNELYVNNGDGTFTGQDRFGSGRRTFAVAWADADNDGDVDLAAGNGSNNPSQLFVNDGAGGFTAVDAFGAARTTSVAWGDYDRDGDLDLAVGNGILGTAQQNRLYVNDGAGSFTGQDQFGTGQTGSVAWGDADGDGDLDLAVGNGGFGSVGQNYLYLNDGSGGFVERPEFGLGDTACVAWGDADNDGDLDLAVGNWDGGQSYLYVNDGTGAFTALPRFGAHDTNSLAWGDADNDGDLDVATGNGDFTSAGQNYLYLNDGAGNFTELAELGLGSTDAVAWADYDGDGDLDLAVGNEHSPTQNLLFVNTQDDGASLRVTLVGHRREGGAGFSNRDGVGARVIAYEAGHLGDPARLLGMREIEAHGGFSSQGARQAHFGLPGRSMADLRIVWPGSDGSRIVQDLVGVAVGQELSIDESPAPGSYVAGEGLGEPNGNRVRVFAAGGTAAGVDFAAYGAGRWGTNVGSSNVDGGAWWEILTGPGPGEVYGPQVRAFRRDGTAIGKVNFFAYGTLKFGANVAGGELDADGFHEIVSGAGPGAVFGPHVRGWDYDGSALGAISRVSFFAYATLKYGLNVATGDVEHDTYAELLTGPGPGTVFGAQVRGFDYDGAVVSAMGTINFDAYEGYRQGVTVAGGDVDGDGAADIGTAPGPGPSNVARLRGFSPPPVAALAGFDITPFASHYGARLGLGELTGDAARELLAGAGPDPSASATVLAWSYASGGLQALAGAGFQPFPDTFGVNVTAGDLYH